MKLSDLEATFVGKYSPASIDDGKAISESYCELPTVEGAQGLLFICPKCGNHSILCWFKNPRNAPAVPIETYPKPGRWEFGGDEINSITLTPSVDLSQGKNDKDSCLWHGFVKNGDAA